MENSINIFITYSWDKKTNDRIYSFVDFLRQNGFNATCDRNTTDQESAASFTKIMNLGLQCDKVIVVLSELYKTKAENSLGGVGIEYKIISNEMSKYPNKYILVSFDRLNNEILAKITPILYTSHQVIDLVEDSQNAYQTLFSKLLNIPQIKFSKVADQRPEVVTSKPSAFNLMESHNSNQCIGYEAQGYEANDCTSSKLTFRFSIALSFSGEYRERVISPLANRLASVYGHEKILYDKFYEAEFARLGLSTYLPNLYHNEAEFIVVFLCGSYNSKTWCSYEWRAIQDLLTKPDNVERVIFIRLDDGNVNGFYDSQDGSIHVECDDINSIFENICKRYKLIHERLERANRHPLRITLENVEKEQKRILQLQKSEDDFESIKIYTGLSKIHIDVNADAISENPKQDTIPPVQALEHSEDEASGFAHIKDYFEAYARNSSPALKKIISTNSNSDLIDVKILFDGEDGKDLIEIIEQLSSQNVLFLLGNGGSGKTYAFLRTWDLIIDNYCSIFIRLHTLDDKHPTIKSTIEYLVFHDNDETIKNFYGFWRTHRNTRPLIIFLDGFNEVPDDIQENIWFEVQDMIKELNIIVLISSRYADNLKHRVRNVIRADMVDLDKETIHLFLKRHNADTRAVNNIALFGLIKNPLMLSLYTETAEYYDAVKTSETRTELDGSIKFYGPIYSESTIIWNFYQHELMKEFRETAVSNEDKLLSFLAVNIILPYICYNMQKNLNPKEQFNISSERLTREIENALEIYSPLIDHFVRFNALRRHLKYNKKFSLESPDLIERIKFISTIKLQLFCQLNFVDPQKHQKDSTSFSLFHQQLRDCLAGIYILNGMEICGTKLFLDLAIDNIKTNQPMVRHIAFIEQRNERQNINKQWELLRGNTHIEINDGGNVVKIGLEVFLNNLVAIYKYITYGDFSELDFSNINLQTVALSGYSFQPVKNNDSFKNATFGTRTFSLGGHSGIVMDLAACGKTLVSRDPDSVRIWDTDTGECLDIPFVSEKYNAKVKGLGADILPTNEHIIAYSQSSYVIERDLESGQELSFEGMTGIISYIKYSPNGNYIMAFSADSFVINVWKRNENKTPFYTAIHKGFALPTLSNQTIVYCPNDAKSIHICEYISDSSDSILPIELSENGIISAVAIEAESKYIIVSITNGMLEFDSQTNEVVINDIETLSSRIEFWRHGELQPFANMVDACNSVIMSLKIHPNNNLLAATTIDDTALLWEMDTEASDNIVCNHISSWGGGVTSVAFFSNISTNLSISVQTQQKRGFFIGYSYGKIQSNELCKTSGNDDDETVVYIYTNYTGHKPYVYDISANDKKNRIIGAYSDGCIREWDTENKLLLHSYTENTSFVYCVEYEPNGEFFASGHTDGSIWLWDSMSNVPICELKDEDKNAHDETVRDLKFTNDGRLISCANDNKIKIWNIETQQRIATLDGHTNFVKCLLYYENGDIKRIVSGSTDKTIIIWDASDIKNCSDVATIAKHSRRIRSFALCYDKHTFVSNSEDGHIYEWDIITGEKTERELYVEYNNGESNDGERSAESISYSADGEKLLFGTDLWGLQDKNIKAIIEEWDFTNNKRLHAITLHTGGITCSVYHKKDTQIITGSLDGNIVITDLSSEKSLVTITPSTSFSDKLKGYDLKTVKFNPKWIEGYYFGAVQNEYKSTQLPPEENYARYVTSLRNNLITNPFEYILNDSSNENSDVQLDGETQLTVLVDLLIKNTNGLHGASGRALEPREKTFLLSNLLYLYHEAPPDEQNMFMICELLLAKLDEQNREDNQDFEADLDRLFAMLKEKNPNHIALQLYNQFNKEYGKKDIIISCLNRMYSVCAFYKECREILNRTKINSDFVDCLAESFISNTQNLAKYQTDISSDEKSIICKIITYVASDSILWDKEDLLVYICKMAKSLCNNDLHGLSYGITTQLKNAKHLTAEKVITSIISRFGFWLEFNDILKTDMENFSTQLSKRIEAVYYNFCLGSNNKSNRQIIISNAKLESATFDIVASFNDEKEFYYFVSPTLAVDISNIKGVDFSQIDIYILRVVHNVFTNATYVVFVTTIETQERLLAKISETEINSSSFIINKTIYQNHKTFYDLANKIGEAQSGNYLSAFTLGSNFIKGITVPCIVGVGIKWLSFAGINGIDASYYELGQLWYNGIGVEQDYDEAIKWYTKAAKTNSEAQCMLGYMYLNGIGVDTNLEKAFNYYMLAAKNENPVAQFNLGVIYDTGNGVRRSPTKSIYWHKKALHQNYKNSILALARKYYHGQGVFKNYKKSFILFKSLPQDSETLYYLGCMYATGKGCKKNFRTAIRCFESSIEDNSDSLYQLGLAYLKGKLGLLKNLALATQLLSLAANEGHYQAQLILINGFMHGKFGLPKNEHIAAFFYNKATETCNPNFGLKLLNGVFNDVEIENPISKSVPHQNILTEETIHDVLRASPYRATASNIDDENIKISINKIVSERLALEETNIRPNSRFVEDLNADSLDIVELVMALEEEFDTAIDDETIESVKTVSDLYALAKNNIGKVSAHRLKERYKTQIFKEQNISTRSGIGFVKWFNQEKGYGFIESDNGEDVFVHFTAINTDENRALSEGQRVKFEIIDGDKGSQVSNVSIINADSTVKFTNDGEKPTSTVNSSMLKQSKDGIMENVEVVELFDDDGASVLFELLDTIIFDRQTYILLTVFSGAESSPKESEKAEDVFVMKETINSEGEKVLEPIDDVAILNQIFDMFKKNNEEKYSFV